MKRKLKVKMMKYSLIIGAILFFALNSHANILLEKEKIINKSFSIDPDGMVDISNKYGDVNIETTAGSKVEIEATIIVDTNDGEKASEIFERVNVNFNNSDSRVTVATEIEEQNQSWWKNMWSGSNGPSFKVHMKIKMPKSCALTLYNKYGNIYTDDIDNDAIVELKYGNIQLGNVSGELQLDLKYGKGSVQNAGNSQMDIGYYTLKGGSLGNLNLDAKYSNFDFGDAKDVMAEMKYSDLKIGHIEHFQAESKYDKFHIESARTIVIECKYTNISVDELKEKGLFETGYGGVKVMGIANGFSEMKIYSNYTSYKLGFDNNTSYTLDFMGEYSNVRGAEDLDATIDIQKGKETTLKGKSGNGAGGLIYARMEYGGLTIL